MARQRSNEAAPEGELGELVGEPKLVDLGEPKLVDLDEPKPVETWRGAKKTPAWLFAAAKTMHRWPEGRVIDEAAYDAAIAAAGSVRIGGHATYPLPRRTVRRK